MKAIDNLISRVKRFKQDIPIIINETFKDNESIIIDYIIEDQLFEKGVDSDGNSLGDYSPITISIKRQKGQPTNRITLRDTEDYVNSYSLETRQNDVAIKISDHKFGEIIARFPKTDALTDENLRDILKNYLLPDLIKRFNSI